MKKVTLMLVVMALLTLTAIGVSAAGSDSVDDITPSETGKYSVTYTGTEGEMYGFVVIEGDATTASTSGKIVYIDQQTAGTGGALNFADFGLLDLDPTAENYNTICTVFIGGAGVGDTAKAIAELVPTPASVDPEPPSGDGVTVSGTITDTVAGHTKDATITLTPADGEPITGTATKDDSKTSTFSISDVPAGTYTVKISKIAYLNYIYTGVTVGAEALDLGATNISTLAGNVDNEGVINIYDLNPVLGNFNKSGAAITDANANVDGEGAVNIYDLNPVLNSFNDGDVTVAYTPAA